MNLETPVQRIVIFGLCIGLLAVALIVFGAVFASLSDTNQKDFAHWIDKNWTDLWKWLAVVVPLALTFLFGRSAGRKAGKTEAYNSAIATSLGKDSGDAAAEALREEAKGHNLNVTV